MALSVPEPKTADHARRAGFGVYCGNAPTVPIGNFLEPDLVVPITQYAKLPWLGGPVYWCAPSSRTYITLHYYGDILPVSWNAIHDCLKRAFDRTQAKIQTGGDRLILGGFFFWGDEPDTEGVYLHTQNVYNHQQTWGVLGAAISALQDFSRAAEGVGIVPRNVGFRITDGVHSVGTGDLASGRVDFNYAAYHY